MTAIVKDISVHPDFKYHNRRVDFEQKTPAQKLLEVSAARRKASDPRQYHTYMQFRDYPTDKGGVTESGLTPEQAKGLGFDMSVLSPEALATLLRDDD